MDMTTFYENNDKQNSKENNKTKNDNKVMKMKKIVVKIKGLLLSTFQNVVEVTKEVEVMKKNSEIAFGTINRLKNNYKNILESNLDALIVIDIEKNILYKNPAANALFPYKNSYLKMDYFDLEEFYIGTKEIVIYREDGEEIIADLSITKTNWEGRKAYLLSIKDITEKVRFLEKIREQAITDELTSLYNRRGFFNLVEKELSYAKRRKKGLTLYFVDIDGMKWINDMLLHNDGDMALIETAKILKNVFNCNDIISRIGGDEFVILSLDSDEKIIQEKIQKLKENQEFLNRTKKYRFRLSFSVGVLYFDPSNPSSIDELMSKADRLMYVSKNEQRRSDYSN
ncbi:MAG: diguanylate cyclase [Clostridiaceae bacterium]